MSKSNKFKSKRVDKIVHKRTKHVSCRTIISESLRATSDGKHQTRIDCKLVLNQIVERLEQVAGELVIGRHSKEETRRGEDFEQIQKLDTAMKQSKVKLKNQNEILKLSHKPKGVVT